MTTQNEAKRQEIKDRVGASQARNASKSVTANGGHSSQAGHASFADRAGEKAIEAKDGISAFAREHPVLTVAGGLAVGVLVAGMFKTPRRAAAAGGAKAAGLAAIAAELASAYAANAMEATGRAGRAGADKLDEFGGTLGDAARSVRRDANYRLSGASDTARSAARDITDSIARAFHRH